MTLLCLTLQGFSQFRPSVDLSQDEEQLYDKCKDQFFNEDYVESYQGFSQLLSLYPREEVFNYYYGACLVKLNNNIKSGIDYLEFAAAKGINPANFYIGLGYHYMYDFNKALTYYDVYKKEAKQKDIVNFEVEQYINMAKSGIDLVKYAYELNVISNKKINKSNFHYSYNLNEFGGSIIVKTDQFNGKADKDLKELDLMYISEVHNVLFFSSYGDSKKNSLDLYMSRKENNNWSLPQKLPDVINTKYEEAYPFLSEDGISLYFSSKGHNSMGGYDIFRTVWDATNNTWSQPVNLDFPVNTPFDEIMYAVDRFNETAFFASTRDTKVDKIGVFRILTEDDPQKRKLESMADIYQNASLQVNPVAMTELSKRQEIRAVAMQDTSSNSLISAVNKDSITDTDVLIQNAFTKLDEKSEITAGYLEYAASAFKLTELKLKDIKNLNNQIVALKNKSDAKSVQLRDSLTEIANKLSIEASELYNITKYFSDAATQTNGLISYYQSELKVLDNTSRNEKTLPENVKRLDLEINKIYTEFPFDTYVTGLEKEKVQKSTKLDSYKVKNEPWLEKLEVINDKIILKMNLASKEVDFDVREKYVYDLKSYENEKIDIISVIKENDIQVEFINQDILIIDEKLILAEKFRSEIENGLFYNPELNVSKLNNEIDLLKTSVTQNQLKELSEAQDRILADLTLYSPKVDYDGILYGTTDIANNDHTNVFVDIETYTEKYSNIISDKTIRTGNLIAANDSLREVVKTKEILFDTTTNEIEKQRLIMDINNIQSEISENSSLIQSGFNSSEKTDISSVIVNYKNIKQNPTIPETATIITETDNLISESEAIKTEIEDLKLLDKNGNSQGIQYLEVIKADIDNKIATNVKDIEEQQVLAASKPDIKNILAELDKNLSPQDKHTASKKILFDDLKKAEKLYADAAKQRDVKTKNDIITEANAITERGKTQSVEFFNESLITMYSDFTAYETAYNKIKSNDEKVAAYLVIAKTKKIAADNLQLSAEESSDDKTKAQILASAYKEMELANLYFEYVFSIIENENNYSATKTLTNNNQTLELVALATGLETQQPEELIAETITDIKPEIIESIISDAEKIQNKTEDLTNEFKTADTQRKNGILTEIKTLNEKLNDKIADLNAEIVKAQKEVIINNYTQLEEENPGVNFADLEKEVVSFNEKANTSVDSKDFYMLGEVIISGDRLIKKQNDLLKAKTILQISDSKISDLIAAADKSVQFVNEQLLVAQNNNIGADTATNQVTDTLLAYNNIIRSDSLTNIPSNNTDSLNNNLPLLTNNIIADTAANIITINNLQNNQDSLNNILANNVIIDTVTNTSSRDSLPTNITVIADANTIDSVTNPVNNIEKQPADLTELIAELEKLNYDNNIEDLITVRNANETDIAENSEKIAQLNKDIEATNRKSTRDKLKQELIKTEKEQTASLVQQSQSGLELISKLESIAINGKISSKLPNDTAYIGLLSRYREQQNSIISYNNFYSAAELVEISEKAAVSEARLIEILLTETSDLDPKLLALNNNSQSDTATNGIISTSQTASIPENLEFDYSINNEVKTKLAKLETQIDKLNIAISENEKVLADLEKAMENSNTMAEYKKNQAALEKAQQKYLKQLKEYATLNTDYLQTKYNIAETHYSDNLLPESNKIRPVSDSLKEISDYSFKESLALFEVIIKYGAKVPDKELIEKYHEASQLTRIGLSHINAANNLATNNNSKDPIVLAYYQSIEKNDSASLITINNTTTDTVTKDTVLIATNNNITNPTDTATISHGITNNIANNSTNQQTTELVSILKTENNIFDANKESLYSDANPILNLEVKEELCYRIQIGAYNVVVNNDKFKGMSPIFIEGIPNSILLRYMAGLFYTFNSANKSLPEVRGMGYPDAFVVAYHNGKRITVYEARQIEERLWLETQESVLAVNNTIINNNTTDSNNTVTATDTVGKTIETINPILNVVNIVDTVAGNQTTIKTETELKNTKDVFYCIQIGVFRERVGSERLYNLSPVMYDQYGNGLIRHTFGKYYDLNTAIAEQNKIRQLGIKDAFVIAYSNGEKIATNQAAALIAQNNNLPQDQIVINVPATNQIAVNNQANVPVVDRTQPEIETTQPVQKSKVEYYVQLGAFRSDVGTYIKDSFRRIAGDKKLFKLTANNMIVYRTGIFTSYSSAQTGLSNARQGGIPDAFIIAFVNGKRVDIATARAAE